LGCRYAVVESTPCGAREEVSWQQGNNRLLMIPEAGACGRLIEAHDRWDGDPVCSSVMQATVEGGAEWPSSAEDRLQTFVSSAVSQQQQQHAEVSANHARNFVDIIKSDKLKDLLSQNLRDTEKKMSPEQFKREMLEWKEQAEKETSGTGKKDRKD